MISKWEEFQKLPLVEKRKRLDALTADEAEYILHNWEMYARPNQLLPVDKEWYILAIIAGRGFGKTRTGAEAVRHWINKGFKYVNLMGATKDDAIDIMVNGESGILAICNKWDRPEYKNKQLHWPSGAISLIFSAEEPERLRGKQHEKLWCDEVGSWVYQDSFDQAMMGLRLGSNPQCIVTTTPRPTDLIKTILKDPGTYIVSGTTYDNKANLAPAFFSKVISKYEGTRLGRQELNAELLEENPNALWPFALIENARVSSLDDIVLTAICVSIDPAVTSNVDSDMTGIVVSGRCSQGDFYVLKDLTGVYKPHEWANVAINAYHEFGATKMVAEVNNGGDLVEATIKAVDRNVRYKSVHASKSKVIRAEPIASYYEQGRVHHVGVLVDLEKQMVNFTGIEKKSPDRVDALVWGLTYLSTNNAGGYLDLAEEHFKEQKRFEDDVAIERNKSKSKKSHSWD